MSTKKDAQTLFSIISECITKLTEQEYTDIVNGNATFMYVKKELPGNKQTDFENIWSELKKEQHGKEESLAYLKVKLENNKKIQAFCEYMNIKVKSKDTKDVLLLKIIEHIQPKEEQSRAVNTETIDQEIDSVHRFLEGCTDVEEARKYLVGEKKVGSKKNLLLLAKTFDVHIRKELTKEEVLNRIIESVVASKIRSKAIRGY